MSMASGNEGPSSTAHSYTNRLSKEKSPYLLQHAHNPVDWYPWGQDAFDKAKNEDKPIFLSVGYSTCHWCHVMERESFEDEEIGSILSKNFVCIKVDREERPDVDKVYMTFVQATSGGGGWPMSVWLTPDLRPFIGGTYFPPRDHGGRLGLKTVLTRIMDQWQNNRPALESSGERMLETLKKGITVTADTGESPPLATDVANRCFQQLAHSYVEEYGGFRHAPKFPTPVNLLFLMSYWSVNRSTSEGVKALQMALHTLRMMALGGIRDHVAQGFHRYSTDSSWHVPHFEKMLYDQAQLAVAYITASQVSGEKHFAEVAEDILRYVSRDLSDKSGGFFSAEDADSLPALGGREKREGAFYVWTAGDVRELLPDVVEGTTGTSTLADIFSHYYGVKEQGNVAPEQDPHGELHGQNVLIVRYSVALTAARFGISVDKVNELLVFARAKAAEVRKSRPRPHLDTKMLASWNGLMLSAYARVGAVLRDKALLERAVQAGNFLKEHLWDVEQQTLFRSSYCGEQMEVQQSMQAPFSPGSVGLVPWKDLLHPHLLATYLPGSQNTKSDALSRQFAQSVEDIPVETILPSSCVVGAAQWEVEQLVSGGPASSSCSSPLCFLGVISLFIIRRGPQCSSGWHSSKVACHPGIHRTFSLPAALLVAIYGC
ncbi:spermatogenesis-associated protein 20 isoform X2 [Echeneis naucrates]|uniref:spermatogenesis-associated protein 20 isoform X2 n=1 Tax=Echeneis naucrates TaxID=173247 RepID=UPI001113C291|nr:spermatogenesis-associated protein 20 isoform X2 [Echeneis naucrates]